MAREIPEAVRAAAGLAATVLDEVRKLPGELTHLPVRLLGLAMQTSLMLQQQYSGLVARGDEVFTGLWGSAESGMATFDEDLPGYVAPTANRTSAFDLAAEPGAAAAADALAAEEELTEALVEEALAEEFGGDPADLTLELSDQIADISDTSELAVVAGLADLTTDADPDALATEVPAAQVPEVGEDAVLPDVLGFETLAGEGDEITDAQVAALPADLPADTVTEAVDELAEEVDAELAAELPESVPDEVADDLAADTVATVADALAADGGADTGTTDGGSPGSVPDEAATVRDLGVVGAPDADTDTPDLALPEATGSPEAPATDTAPAPADTDEPAAEPDAPTDEPIVAPTTDEALATEAEAPTADAQAPDQADAPETAAPAADETPGADNAGAPAAEADAPTVDTAATADTDAEADTEADTEAPAADGENAGDGASAAEAPTEPVPGYDSYSIPSLRGHLRGYTAEMVADLLDYERATQARPPYITLLQNRLEKLSADRG